MPEKSASLTDFVKQNHIGRATLVRFVQGLDFADAQIFGAIEDGLVAGHKIAFLTEKQQNFLFAKMPNLRTRPAPEGFRPLDDFARENHVRVPAIKNFLEGLSLAERQNFGDFKEFKDTVGKINVYISPEQMDFLQKNDPHFYTDFAPEGFLTLSAFAKKNHTVYICVKV